jgi:alkyl hydroperoxide reductase subunit AhpC
VVKYKKEAFLRFRVKSESLIDLKEKKGFFTFIIKKKKAIQHMQKYRSKIGRVI